MAPRACTIVQVHLEGRWDSSDRSVAASLQEEVGGRRQIPRNLGYHALEAGLGLVSSEEILQTLKQNKDMVNIYDQEVFGLHGIGLEQKEKKWGCYRNVSQSHDMAAGVARGKNLGGQLAD